MANNDDQEKGFKVTDRRVKEDEEVISEEKEQKDTDKGPEAAPSVSKEFACDPLDKPEGKSEEPEKKPKDESKEEALSPLDFTQFILSLASSAMIHLGDVPHPVDGQQRVDLNGAQQTIDILAILEEKTRRNLSPQEESMIKNILADLRVRFVEKKAQK